MGELISEDAELLALGDAGTVGELEVVAVMAIDFAGRVLDNEDAVVPVGLAASENAGVCTAITAGRVWEDGADPRLIDIEAVNRLEVIAKLELEIGELEVVAVLPIDVSMLVDIEDACQLAFEALFWVVVTSTGATTESTVTVPKLLAKLADDAFATKCFANRVGMEGSVAAAMIAAFAARVVLTLYETCRVCARRLPCRRRPTANVVIVEMPAMIFTATLLAATPSASEAAIASSKTLL